MNLNKNISIWRGDSTPPTNYHFWIKSNGLLFTFNGEKWVNYVEDIPTASLESKGLMSSLDKVNLEECILHLEDTSNPHSVTKTQVGLGNVTNDVQVKRSEMGVANGVATLDANGKVPTSQLPSYVDDIIDVYATYSKSDTGVLSNVTLYLDAAHTLLVTGEAGKIYQNIADGEPQYQFRWTGTIFSQTGASSLILGEVTGTAYDGAKGKANADNIAKIKGTSLSHIKDAAPITTAADKVSINYECFEGDQYGAAGTDHTADIPAATTSKAGVMSATDKTKLENLNSKLVVADEEDVTAVEGKIKFKDRDTTNGMGYKILRLPENGILTQDMISEANTIYEIRYDFDLNGATITIPENCTLKFEGGSLANGSITSSMYISNPTNKVIFKDSLVISDKILGKVLPEWFERSGNDDSQRILRSLQCSVLVELTGNYTISLVTVPSNVSIINKGKVTTTGSGFILKSSCHFSGGSVYTSEGSTGFEVGDSLNNTRRVMISNVKIVGVKLNDTAINLIGSDTVYVSFCFLLGVSIYNCFRGVYGNIRASMIDVAIELCVDNFHLTNGKMNILNITGQAGPALDAYPYFCTIVGDLNVLNTRVYDIGQKNYQKYMVKFIGNYNTTNYIGEIEFTNSTNSYSDGYGGTKYLVENPIYDVTYSNVAGNILTGNPFVKNKSYLEGNVENVGLESYIEYTLGPAYFFYGFGIEAFTGNYTFSKVVLMDGENVIAELLGNKTSISWFYSTYDNYYKHYQNLKIRCYLTKLVRIRRIFLYGTNMLSDNIRLTGSDSVIPSNLNSSHFGLPFFSTDRNRMIFWNGTKWVDPAEDSIKWRTIE